MMPVVKRIGVILIATLLALGSPAYGKNLQDHFIGIDNDAGIENDAGIGDMKLMPQCGSYFKSLYPDIRLDEEDAVQSHPETKWRHLSNSTLTWFPDINSREYEAGYGMEHISVGEQLLYSLGMILLQVSANELDQSINDDRTRR